MIRYRSYLRRSKRIRPNPLLLIVFAAFVGYIVIFAIISLLSIVSSKVSPDQSIMSIFTTAALFVGAFIGGYISAKNRHKNGLLMGVCCGLFMFLVIIVVGLVLSSHSGGAGAPAKFFITVIAGGVGGVVGINSSTFR